MKCEGMKMTEIKTKPRKLRKPDFCAVETIDLSEWEFGDITEYIGKKSLKIISEVIRDEFNNDSADVYFTGDLSFMIDIPLGVSGDDSPYLLLPIESVLEAIVDHIKLFEENDDFKEMVASKLDEAATSIRKLKDDTHD